MSADGGVAMTSADDERLRTWVYEIVEAIIEGVAWRQEGDERRAVGQSGLTINARKGCWYAHAAGKGGVSVLPLIQLLKSCSRAEATAWGQAWLRSHPGTGSAIAGDGDDDRQIEYAAIAQEIIAKLVDPAGTPAETYLRSRGIAGALPECIGFLADARVGESALAGLLTSHRRIVGVQLCYLDPDGRKSTILPGRRRFMLERAPDAVFVIASRADGVTDMLTDIVVGEGLEDALSLAELGRQVSIVGLPGIGALRQLSVKRSDRIIVVRDGDEPDSAADKALTAGIDALLLQGAAVKVTATPPGEDANAILQHGGPEALAELLAKTHPAELSIGGEFTRLSRLEPVDYDRERKPVAERLGIRLPTLDHEVAKRRAKDLPPGHGDSDGESGQGKAIEVPVIEVWPEAVEGIEVLDQIADGIRKYVVIEREQADAIALWVVETHAFDTFEVAPKLVLKSAVMRSGKTRMTEVLERLVAKPLGASGISAAALLSVIEKHTPTMILDEFDTMMRGDAELAEALRGILNSGFNRATARVIKNVPVAVGRWEQRWFSTWCPQVLAGIGSLPATVADRSIIIEMQRKKRPERVSRLRSRDGGELRVLARKAARWAEDHAIELADADPATPSELNDRAADAWAPLFAIADAAGGEWPQRARIAAIRLSGGEVVDTRETELLADIRDAFADKKADAMSSDDLVTFLVQLEDRPWAEINRGRPLTKNGLAAKLKPFKVRPRTIKLGKGPTGRTAKGYQRSWFEDAFERYLSPPHPSSPDRTVTLSPPQDFCGFQQGFEPSPPLGGDVSKIAQNPIVSAGGDGVTVENAENEGGAQKEASLGPAPNDEARLNGGVPPLCQIDLDMLAYAASNPTKSVAAIAEHFGQPKAVVAELLGRDR